MKPGPHRPAMTDRDRAGTQSTPSDATVARFPGQCARCFGKVEVGQMVEPRRNDRGRTYGWQHAGDACEARYPGQTDYAGYEVKVRAARRAEGTPA
jgi:hypothetical protein